MQSFCALIDYHLDGESGQSNSERVWRVAESEISGRGVFAVRDIRPGEVIFKEKPLLIGPTAGKTANLNICSVCYQANGTTECPTICPRGCSLPICELCLDSKQHVNDCVLFRSWKPLQPEAVSRTSIRALVLTRGLLLNDKQKQLLNALQANQDPSYKNEVSNAATNFQRFPSDKDTLAYLLKIVCVLNTNAFEALQQNEKGDISLRGLYPLSGIMNHQCTPNTCHFFEGGNVMVVRSAKYIPKDAEITTTYTKILWGNLSRRMFLTMTKKFECSCSRCLDPTENGSYLSALLCRANDCHGWVIPENCSGMTSDWRCIKCGKTYDNKHISKVQDFTVRIMSGRTSSGSIKETLEFIREKAPRICPPPSQFIVEMKLNVIWRMTKSQETYSKQDIQDAIQYCRYILCILEKLEAGECILKSLLSEEIGKFNAMLDTLTA